MYGVPGSGKTLIARAVAGETECSFIRVIGSELAQKYIGQARSATTSNLTICDTRSHTATLQTYRLLIRIDVCPSTISHLTICDTRVTRTLQTDCLLIRIARPCDCLAECATIRVTGCEAGEGDILAGEVGGGGAS